MGAYLLIGAGAIFAVLFALNNLVKTLLRREKVSFFDILLAFLTALVPASALIIASSADAAPDAAVAWGALVIGGGLAAFSVLVLILELFRPQRLKGSRGILGLYSGALLVLASFAVPFMAAYTNIRAEIGAAPTAVAQADAASAAEADDSLTAEQEERARQLFKAISQAVTDEIDVDPALITDALQNGTPLAMLIEENGGSVENVVTAITEIMRAGVRDSAARGEINALQAALALSQMENFIRLAVNSDLYELAQQVGGATPDPNATRPNLFEIATDQATVTGTPRPPKGTATPTPTASPTPTPTETNTLRPTPTPSLTRFTYNTRTPTATATAVTPCVASVEYNLRLRAAPDYDAETLLVIPFGTTVELYGKGGASDNDALWWYAEYEGQSGWLDGGYMLVSSACDSLPSREG